MQMVNQIAEIAELKSLKQFLYALMTDIPSILRKQKFIKILVCDVNMLFNEKLHMELLIK